MYDQLRHFLKKNTLRLDVQLQPCRKMTELNRPIGTQKKVNEKETGNAKTYSLVPLFQTLKGKEKIQDNGILDTVNTRI